MIEQDPSIVAMRQSKANRFASLWTITREDGTIFRYTDYSQSIEYGGNTFEPATTTDASALQSPQGLAERNRKFMGYLSNAAITEDDLRAGKFNQATVEEVRVDYRYPWQGAFSTHTYYITELKWTGETWEAQLDGLTTRLRQQKGETITKRCRWELFDSNCGLDEATHREEGLVVDGIVTQRRVFDSDLAGDFSDDYFNLGLITWVDGENANTTSRVLDYDDSTGRITLLEPTKFDIDVNDEFDIYPGCDHTEEHCKGNGGRPWSSNFSNYGGFPHVPGTTKSLLTPDAK